MKEYGKIFFLTVFLLAFGFANAQNTEDTVKLNGKYFLGYLKDTWGIIKAPVTWDETDWSNFGVTGGLAFTAYMFDHNMISWMKNNRSNFSNTLSDIFEPLGRSSALMPFSIVICTYGLGALAGNYRLKKTSLLALESFAISGFFVQVIKYSINRERPYYGSLSFPSGHTGAVFAVASVFAYEFRDKVWLGVLLYTAATLTALSRINDLRHYPSDVLVGFAMGNFMGRYIARAHDPERKLSLSIYPAYHNKTPLLGLTYRFN